MDLEQIHESLKEVLNESRYKHSLGVKEVAQDLAVIYGYNEDKAILGGVLHDCARYLSNDALLQECDLRHISITEIERSCPVLLHAKVGALFARIKYGVEDEEVINAITYHTTGRPKMTLLEKIIFTADYIEPYRKPLPRIDEIRKAAYRDLDYAVVLILENMVNYLKDSQKAMDQTTLQTYEYYKKILVL